MGISQYPKPLRDAIREIAELNARQQFPQLIEDSDCEAYAKDDDVLLAFWELAAKNGDDYERLDALFQRMPQATFKQFLAAVVKGHACAGKILRDAMVTEATSFICVEARLEEENLEPSEQELTDEPARVRRCLDAGVRPWGAL